MEQLVRKKQIEDAALEIFKKVCPHMAGDEYFHAADKSVTIQACILMAKWADENPYDQNNLIIDLIHQRSVAFDYGREQSQKLAIAIEALEKYQGEHECTCKDYGHVADEALGKIR